MQEVSYVVQQLLMGGASLLKLALQGNSLSDLIVYLQKFF
jgi:hypothetical protein